MSKSLPLNLTSDRIRKIHEIGALLWLCPGLPICWWLQHSIFWVVFMSWYAIEGWHLLGARQEANSDAD